jgi:hypothetical protein
MILTNCAACAAPLAHDATQCVRCQSNVIEAVAILEELLTTARRIYGTHHHFPGFMQKDLEAARSKLSFLARHAVGATPKDN